MDSCEFEEGKCAQKDLTVGVNFNLERLQETFGLNAHEVGRALTSLGFTNRKRANSGFILWLDLRTRKRIHELAHAYAIDQGRRTPRRRIPAATVSYAGTGETPILLQLIRKRIAESNQTGANFVNIVHMKVTWNVLAACEGLWLSRKSGHRLCLLERTCRSGLC